MLRCKLIIFASLLSCGLGQLRAQSLGQNLKVFGYFQVSFEHHESTTPGTTEVNSFNLQQLNLFLQKQLLQNWTIFINFEFVNSYSSFRNWGAHNLEEAWVSYQASAQFKLKLGLLVPTFNNLNEIKNRTPLLPYIIRPLVYESSFNEIIELDQFVPGRAFIQAYGFIPAREAKIDYAVFVGDSPNINNDPTRGQTGVDTTNSFLIGGRIGIRTNNLKLGASATFDYIDMHRMADSLHFPAADFTRVPRLRLGADFSLNLGKFAWESELIQVTYDEDYPAFDFDKRFYYGTLGYHFTEQLFAYGGYWVSLQNALPLTDQDFTAPTVGMAYQFNDAIVMKGQYGRAGFESSTPVAWKETVDYYFLAISVVF